MYNNFARRNRWIIDGVVGLANTHPHSTHGAMFRFCTKRSWSARWFIFLLYICWCSLGRDSVHNSYRPSMCVLLRLLTLYTCFLCVPVLVWDAVTPNNPGCNKMIITWSSGVLMYWCGSCKLCLHRWLITNKSSQKHSNLMDLHSERLV